MRALAATLSRSLLLVGLIGCRDGFEPTALSFATDQICDEIADCARPPTGAAICFDPSCVDGSCVYSPIEDRACEPARCEDGLLLYARRCDVEGACLAQSPEGSSCLGYACDADGERCLTTCSGDADCAGSLRCAAQGRCEALRPDGAACSSPVECQSELCVDHVCCDLPCVGNCDRCDLAGSEGHCLEDDTQCLGDCDRCDDSTGDCIADPSRCSGRCASCDQLGPNKYQCQASQAACTGTCDRCAPVASAFECVAEPSACDGDCASCASVGPGLFDCQGDDGVCELSCTPSTCAASGSAFHCDFSTCTTCLTEDAPSLAGECGSGTSVLLPSGCQYSYDHSEVSGNLVFYDWLVYECQSGVWTFIEGDADASTCSTCEQGHLDIWSDDCGGSSSHQLRCP